jgi:uncharacterized membrane protein YdbT with pleckstrin-like domain
MKWLYIVIGMIIIFYVGRVIEWGLIEYNTEHKGDEEVTIIKSGAQP